MVRDLQSAAPLTEADLEVFWRKDPNFIGPVAAPMWLWMHDRAKQAAWRKVHGLTKEVPDADFIRAYYAVRREPCS